MANAKAASARTEARKAEAVEVPGISRREFLYYAWGASIALLTAQTGGLLIWFGLPRFKEGEFGGIFPLKGAAIPPLGSVPTDYPDGKFWLSHSEEGVAAIYKVCTHLGCLYKWVDANSRFECPCHGSKFEINGKYIEGPAPRSLDRFAMTITTRNGEELTTDTEGNPIEVSPDEVDELRIDTGTRIKRDGRV